MSGVSGPSPAVARKPARVVVAEEETPAPSPVGTETVLQAESMAMAARPATLSSVRLFGFGIGEFAVFAIVMPT
ncbi:hypothetical protein GCM10007881_18470 [Mesorhizobium huakuii]|nr:hypothetical protein GCM10007881_18470 [Mesorhizobium huakuii]